MMILKSRRAWSEIFSDWNYLLLSTCFLTGSKTHLQHLNMRNFHNCHHSLNMMMTVILWFAQIFRFLEDIVEDVPLFGLVIVAGCSWRQNLLLMTTFIVLRCCLNLLLLLLWYALIQFRWKFWWEIETFTSFYFVTQFRYLGLLIALSALFHDSTVNRNLPILHFHKNHNLRDISAIAGRFAVLQSNTFTSDDY